MVVMARNMRRAAQQGFSMWSMLAWGLVLLFAATLALKLFSPVNEYLTLRRTIQAIKNDSPTSQLEVQRLYQKHQAVEYSLQSVQAQDLEVVMNGPNIVSISFAYNREVPLFGPAYILLKFQGTTR